MQFKSIVTLGNSCTLTLPWRKKKTIYCWFFSIFESMTCFDVKHTTIFHHKNKLCNAVR